MRTVRVTAASGLLALVLLVTGCGAGQTAATSQDLPSVPGLNVEADGIAVRNMAVEFTLNGYEPGETAPIDAGFFNNTAEPVTLVEATSPSAAGVEVADEPLEIPPAGYVFTQLNLTDLTTRVDAADSVPVELTFSNGATLALEVPIAPPLDRVGEREPIDT